jgi:hypothetical protein
MGTSFGAATVRERSPALVGTLNRNCEAARLIRAQFDSSAPALVRSAYSWSRHTNG